MATTTIFCPACNHKLRVPDDLMGQPVECPKCQAMFTAPPPAMPPTPDGEPPNRERDRDEFPAREAQQREFDDDYPRRRAGRWDDEELAARSQGKLVAPAIILMILSTLALLASLARVVIALFFPKIVEQLQANNAQIFGQMGGGFNMDMRVMYVVFGAIFAVVSLVSFCGGVAMLRRQMYWLAMAGSIAAMINLTDCCCLFGLPVGMWALIILLQSDVKASFS